MQKIALHPKEMNIGLMEEKRTPWIKYAIIIVVIVAAFIVLDMMGRMYIQSQANKLKGNEAYKQ